MVCWLERLKNPHLLSLSLTRYMISEDKLLIHKLQSLTQQTHTCSHHILISKLSDGFSRFWDVAQLQECQPRLVPMCHPAVPRGRKQPRLLAAAHNSQVLNFFHFHTCPPLQRRSGLGYLLCPILNVTRTYFSMPKLNLLFQSQIQLEEMLHFCKGGIPLETL